MASTQYLRSTLLVMSAKAKTYPAEAVITLSAPLWLGPEFNGLLKSGQIAGVDVHIVLPKFGQPSDEFDTILHPRALVNWVASLRERKDDDDWEWPFGGVARWGPQGQVEEFSAHRLLVLPKDKLTLAEARRLKMAADDWAELLERWIEVVAREDLHRDHVKVDRRGSSAFVWIDRDRKPTGLLPSQQTITFSFGGRLSLTPWQWGKVLKKAGEGIALPEAHAFLRDARQAKNLGHHRRSVLDSATAAELALSMLREELLAGVAPGLAKHVRRGVRQIGPIASLLEKSRKDIPPGIDDEIGKPRNDAIHAGLGLNQETADRALAKAEEVVDLALPWKGLLG